MNEHTDSVRETSHLGEEHLDHFDMSKFPSFSREVNQSSPTLFTSPARASQLEPNSHEMRSVSQPNLITVASDNHGLTHPPEPRSQSPSQPPLLSTRENMRMSFALGSHLQNARASLAIVASEVITMAREVGKKNDDIEQTYWQASAINEEIQRILTIMFTTSMVGILFMVVENEVLHANDNKWDATTTVLKSMISLSTIIAEWTLWKYYNLTAHQMRVRGLVLNGSTALPSKHWIYFTLEFICIAIHPPPGLDFSFTVTGMTGRELEYTFDTIFGLMMLSRLYMLARMLKYVSGLHQRTAQVIGTLNKVEINPSFALKTILHKRPYTFLMSALFINLFVSAYAVHICERVVPDTAQENYLESIWFMFVTIATIGYGDVIARTYCARTFVMIGSVFGVITTALLISIVDQTLQLSQAQARVVTLLTKEKWTRTLKETAALSVQRMWRLRKAKGPSFFLRQKATSALHDWKEARRSYAAFLDKNDVKVQLQPLVEQLVGDFQLLSAKMEVMEAQMNRMESVLSKLENVVPPSAQRQLNVEGGEGEHGAGLEDHESLSSSKEQPDVASTSKSTAVHRRRSNMVRPKKLTAITNKVHPAPPSFDSAQKDS